jgi:hypothetical protein
MRLFGKIVRISGNQVTIELDDASLIHRLFKFLDGKQLSAGLDVEDGRTISPAQRAKIWALIRDTAEYTGDTDEYWEDRYKGYTREIFSYEPYSLSNCSVEQANNMIYTILEFCFKYEVPFRTKIWDSLPSDFPRNWWCLRYRKCVICGRPADIAHQYAVGMGRNRHKISHDGMYLMALCRNHHQEQHRIGIDTFLGKYHIRPIKLDKKERVKLHLESWNTDDQQSSPNRTPNARC